METLGSRIKMMMKVRKTSTNKISEELNVSRQTINSWTSDRIKPNGTNLNNLAEYLNVSVEWLAFGISKESIK
ncbi:MAG: helix-turn-helix domain-containing protein [Staphylococcus equorum]|nr:helix-turn-helix domain-containing protein [Tetragenococcus koreensis]MDN6166872.1 helix-turn-helix domain-containing protein [Tetragenococcus koreensis]MDN6268675.1 helix-turn-helix domain-containing protein [Tetragenococcus koreensis]MDN6571947.1 helix-turn-helix domain-containing protein [Staphylococcus equorum]MDN6612495.1 helix-turn-helix domain-containing protein [Staphylococcus equorum]